MTNKFFNPLDSVDIDTNTSESSNKDPKMESTSMESKYAECPKCHGAMKPVKIINDEDVIWCNGCRVSSPIKE